MTPDSTQRHFNFLKHEKQRLGRKPSASKTEGLSLNAESTSVSNANTEALGKAKFDDTLRSGINSLARDSEERDHAFKAVENMERGSPLSNPQTMALEAIIRPTLRPVLDINNGTFQPPAPPPWENLQPAALELAIAGAGRVELFGGSIPYGGTAFFVAQNIVMTNRHVAELFVLGLGKKLTFDSLYRSALDLRQEAAMPPSQKPALLHIVKPLMIHPYWDMALLEVATEDTQGITPLRLCGSAPSSIDGPTSEVVVIGYPFFDPNQNADLQNRIFRGIYGKKRLQPGLLMGLKDVESFNHIVSALTHDCSTLGGNSGSMVVDVASGQVVALHFAGMPSVANYAVPMWEIARDSYVRSQNLNFRNLSDSTTPPPPPWMPYWTPQILNTETVAASEPASTTVHALPSADQPIAATPGAAINSDAPATYQGGENSENALGQPDPDWFERIDDSRLQRALQQDPVRVSRIIKYKLGNSGGEDLIAHLNGGARTEGLFFNAAPDPNLPEIIFLHGIMGGHLANTGGLQTRIWLGFLTFLEGHLGERLRLKNDGVSDWVASQVAHPDGLIGLYYSQAPRVWADKRFVVRQFSYDWRKSVSDLADRLHSFIESLNSEQSGRKKYVLVAHSMGGLVAAMYANRHAEWSSRIERAIFLGSPLGGSFAPIESIQGFNPLFEKMLWVSRGDDMLGMRLMAATLPGLIDMLPDPDIFPSALPAYTQSAWGDVAAPLQRWLNQSRGLKPLLRGSPLLQRADFIVSAGIPTIVNCVNGLNLGLRTGAGDGTVPLAAAAIVPARSFLAAAEHANLACDPPVIQAVADLIQTGTCSLPALPPDGLRATASALAVEGIAAPPRVEIPISVLAGREALRQKWADGNGTKGEMDWLLSPIAPLPPGAQRPTIAPASSQAEGPAFNGESSNDNPTMRRVPEFLNPISSQPSPASTHSPLNGQGDPMRPANPLRFQGTLSVQNGRTKLEINGVTLEVLVTARPETEADWTSARARTSATLAPLNGAYTTLDGSQDGPCLVNARPSRFSVARSSNAEKFKPVVDAIRTHRAALLALPGVIAVRPGYHVDESGWFTAEPAIVVTVRGLPADPGVSELQARTHLLVDTVLASPAEQLAYDRRVAGVPNSIGSTGDSLATPAWDLLQPPASAAALEIIAAPALERVIVSRYVRPPQLALNEISEEMTLICHASPDAGWPTLKAFLERTRTGITAGIYNFSAPHILETLKQRLASVNGKLELMCDPKLTLTAGGDDDNPKANDISQEDIAEQLSAALKENFQFEYAAVKARGKTTDGLFPSAYHIKVAVRDGQEMWLSSGNWQSSNQPDADPIHGGDDTSSLQSTYNREWHIVVKNNALANLYEQYLKYDFEQAAPFQATAEAVSEALPELVAEDQPALEAAAPKPKFFPPLVVQDTIRIQPLLTPDNYAEKVLPLIQSATKSLAFQNQYVTIGKENPEEFTKLYTALKERASALKENFRMILRDIGGTAKTRDMIDALINVGFSAGQIRLQKNCHNKGIIVDSKIVVLGSHNYSGDGTVYNRDASLIIYNDRVAQYYLDIFDYDWRVRAKARLPRTPRIATESILQSGAKTVAWETMIDD